MHKFIGRWRITWMEVWDQDYIDCEQPGYFDFSENNLGEFAFGYVEGQLDVRYSSRQKRLDYSWQGGDESDPCCGRGFFKFSDNNHGEGQIYFHMGEESAIKIERIV